MPLIAGAEAGVCCLFNMPLPLLMNSGSCARQDTTQEQTGSTAASKSQCAVCCNRHPPHPCMTLSGLSSIKGSSLDLSLTDQPGLCLAPVPILH